MDELHRLSELEMKKLCVMKPVRLTQLKLRELEKSNLHLTQVAQMTTVT